MKIGILTFHRAHNYGAFLQCLSLVSKLRKEFPNDRIEVIDVNTKEMNDYYSTKLVDMIFGRSNIINKNFRFMLSNAKQLLIKELHEPRYIKMKRKQAQLFIDALSYLPLSPDGRVFQNNSEIFNYINDLNYDLIVVGSDAIWNDFQTHRPNPYLLDSSVIPKKISYAASSYGMPYRELDETQRNNAKLLISQFSYIGVRDVETENYLKFINLYNFQHTPDPSLFFPFEKYNTEEMNIVLKKKLADRGVDCSKDIYAIMGGNWLGKIARETIGEDSQLVAIYAQNKYANAYLYDLSPLEWACVFQFFKATFTSFFHGTIFSLQNGTPTFTTEEKSSYGMKYITKTKDLLTRLNLQDYYFSLNESDTLSKIKSQFEIIQSNPQEDRIREALELERKKITSFLDYIRDLNIEL